MHLNIIQPIATIHNDDGTLRAIRVFKAKVEYSGKTQPKQYSERSLVRFTTLTGINITKCLSHSVIDVSMMDVTYNKQLRKTIIGGGSHFAAETSRERVLGSYAVASIKADGTVLHSNVYQVIGTVKRSNNPKDGQRQICIPDAIFIDYAGNTYDAQQLKQLDASITTCVDGIIHGVSAKQVMQDILKLHNADAAGVGNINIVESIEPNMTIMAQLYISAAYTRALSAAALTSSTNYFRRAYAQELHRDVTQFFMRDEDIVSQTAQIDIPLGAEVALIYARGHSIQRITAQQGLEGITYIGNVLPSVRIQTPLVFYTVETQQSITPLAIPPMQSKPGSRLFTNIRCIVDKPKYTDGVISLVDNVYDAGDVYLKFDEQPCTTLIIPLGYNLFFSGVASHEIFSLVAKRTKYKYQRPLRKSDSVCSVGLNMTQRQKILLNFEDCPVDSAVNCAVSYKDFDKKLRVVKTLPRNTTAPSEAPCGGDVVLLLNAKRCCVAQIGTNVNMTIHNKQSISMLTLTYSHSVAAWADVSTQTIVGDVSELDINLAALPNVRHTLKIHGYVNILRISVDCASVTMEQLAQMLQLYTANETMQVFIKIEDKMQPTEQGILFIQKARHDIKTLKT